ncbi:TPA: siderophore-interacting protein [Klebsiella pneumoniae]
MNKQFSRLLRPVQVSQVCEINDRMKRVYLKGESVTAFHDALPAAWVKVFFTPPGEPEGPGRAYTIRNIARTENTMALDIVQHGESPAATWSRCAQPGEIIRVAGPREGVSVQGVRSLLLFGDETAIPGMFAILEALDVGSSVKVFIHTEQDADYELPHCRASLSVTWLQKQADIADHVLAWALESSPEMIWGAGEHGIMLPIRKCLFRELGRTRADTSITAYWKNGEADHRDSTD